MDRVNKQWFIISTLPRETFHWNSQSCETTNTRVKFEVIFVYNCGDRKSSYVWRTLTTVVKLRSWASPIATCLEWIQVPTRGGTRSCTTHISNPPTLCGYQNPLLSCSVREICVTSSRNKKIVIFYTEIYEVSDNRVWRLSDIFANTALVALWQGFLFIQISGYNPIKILSTFKLPKFEDSFCIYRCEFYMPLVQLR